MNNKVTAIYAKTLLEACTPSTQALVLQDIQLLLETFKSFPRLQAVLENPVLANDKKMDLLKTSLLSKLQPLTQKFIHLLYHKNRFAYLSSISKQFLVLEENSRNILRATVVSAVKLSSEQLEKISSKLTARQPGKKFIIENTLDASLIAGFRIVEGDHITDSSVKAQLNVLKRKLAA